jgi:aspartate-semialdehyde dehydrogenase
MKQYNVGILGATGLVGQRLIQRLAGHPWFRITALAASDRSTGMTYAQAASWRLSPAAPEEVAGMSLRPCRTTDLDDCDLVFSALDAEIAASAEPQFAAAGFAVISNSSAFRNHADVPLVIPEVNASHLDLLESQSRRYEGGFIVTNPNCSVTGLAMVLAPLHHAFGVRRVVVATLQAASGAGASGPSALDLLDNVLPYIPNEEDKLEKELSKILGTRKGEGLESAAIIISAHCHRVATVDGHLEAVSLELGRDATVEEVTSALADYEGEIAEMRLPSSVSPLIVVRPEKDRPQPRLDRDTGGGMSVVVGRIRPCPVLGMKLELLSHNAIRGAAGVTILNAELLAARKLLPRRASA